MSNKMRFIGDIHGNIPGYLSIIEGCERSVQVGDFGIGFVDVPSIPIEHRFIRGNHDNPELCKNHPNWIKDGIYEAPIMYIGGAWSIDQAWRTPGVSWWADEELSIKEMNDILVDYENIKPKILVTHEAPSHAVNVQHSPKSLYPNRTQQFLDSLYLIHKPDFHIYGHWHKTIFTGVQGTGFICLGEMEYVDIAI